MTIDFAFEPNPARARKLDARMHVELAASLEHIIDKVSDEISFDETGMRALVRRLREGMRVSPFTFAAYYDLVCALLDENESNTQQAFAELTSAVAFEDVMRIDRLGDPALGDLNERIISIMGAGENTDIGFEPPSVETAAAFRTRLDAGFALLDEALPQLAGEIHAIVRHLIIAGSDLTKKYQFDGASHFQLWGALFLNANFHEDRIAVVEVLAHECSHSLLFGFCTHEPLVRNRDEELYTSPLRVDPRPMDGIFHATFVSARMHWAMSRLAQSPSLTVEEKERAREAAEADFINFGKGYGVVAEHGILTTVGDNLMKNAKIYMDAAQ